MSSAYRFQINVGEVSSKERAEKIIDCIQSFWPELDLNYLPPGEYVWGGGDTYVSGFINEAMDEVVTEVWKEVGYVPIQIDYLYLENLPMEYVEYDRDDFFKKKLEQ
jgi:hypothetical protein